MKMLQQQIRPALVLTILLALLTGVIYPGVVTGLAQLIFPHQANGSLITDTQGNVVGSELIGQYWTAPEYFHGRPSATAATDGSGPQPYNAENSAASNLGPTNRALQERVQADVEALQKENPGVPVPVDLVTASGSGLDPDISVAAALFQVPRVAEERGVSVERVEQLVREHIQPRFLWIFGEERINVLDLNRALDEMA